MKLLQGSIFPHYVPWIDTNKDNATEQKGPGAREMACKPRTHSMNHSVTKKKTSLYQRHCTCRGLFLTVWPNSEYPLSNTGVLFLQPIIHAGHDLHQLTRCNRSHIMWLPNLKSRGFGFSSPGTRGPWEKPRLLPERPWAGRAPLCCLPACVSWTRPREWAQTSKGTTTNAITE